MDGFDENLNKSYLHDFTETIMFPQPIILAS